MAATYLSIWKGTGLNTTKVPIKDGQLLFETDTKKIWLDAGAQRLQVGGQDTIAWNNVTGKPDSFVPVEHSHSFILQDNAVAWVTTNIRPMISIGGSNSSFALEKYTNENHLQWHNYIDGVYDGTYTILDNHNYNEFTVTKTGGGASGLWNIDVAGFSGALKRNDSASNTRLVYTNANQDSYGWGQIMYDSNNKACYVYYSTSQDAEAPSIRIYGPDGGTSALVLTTANYFNYALPISGGSMTGQIQFNGNFSYPGIWFKDATNSKNVGAIYMNPSSNNQLNIRWARDDGNSDGYYYIHCRPSDGAVLATKFIGPLQGAAARLALGGNADNSAMQFNWDSKSGQPIYVWGADDISNAYLYRPSDFSVAKAGFLTCEDTRDTMETPANYTMGADLEFKSGGVTGLSGYSAVLTVKPWSDSSGGMAHQLAFNNSGLYHRISNSDLTSWGDWHKLWQAGDSVTGAVWN